MNKAKLLKQIEQGEISPPTPGRVINHLQKESPGLTVRYKHDTKIFHCYFAEMEHSYDISALEFMRMYINLYEEPTKTWALLL